MTREIANIVASMLGSHDNFSVEDGCVWLPDLDNYAFMMQEHITRALEIHGYIASTSGRSHSGILIDVPEAEPIDKSEAKQAHTAGYGYTGRVAGLNAQGQMWEGRFDEPGNILQIPDVGWTHGRERVVIGQYSGLYLAEVNSNNVETYDSDDALQADLINNSQKEKTLRELADSGRIIVYKGEWGGYPQECF